MTVNMRNETLCKHCDHFVDDNYIAKDQIKRRNKKTLSLKDGSKIARYIHLEDDCHNFDHDAEPGETHTSEEWGIRRPDLFITHPDGRVGPNSKFHNQRGKSIQQ